MDIKVKSLNHSTSLFDYCLMQGLCAYLPCNSIGLEDLVSKGGIFLWGHSKNPIEF